MKTGLKVSDLTVEEIVSIVKDGVTFRWKGSVEKATAELVKRGYEVDAKTKEVLVVRTFHINEKDGNSCISRDAYHPNEIAEWMKEALTNPSAWYLEEE